MWAVEAAYWGDNLRKPVLFSEGIEAILQQHPNSNFIEPWLYRFWKLVWGNSHSYNKSVDSYLCWSPWRVVFFGTYLDFCRRPLLSRQKFRMRPSNSPIISQSSLRLLVLLWAFFPRPCLLCLPACLPSCFLLLDGVSTLHSLVSLVSQLVFLFASLCSMARRLPKAL